MRPQWYRTKDITPRTRLSDLVTKEYHPQLKQMIKELSQLTTLTDQTEWWRVRELEFLNPRTQRNYVPIVKFIGSVVRNGHYGLKCSQNTFYHYLADRNHSNLTAKWNCVKTLVISRLRYKEEQENW